MIPARKGGPGTWLVGRYVDLKVRRAFRAMWVRGELPRLERGTLIYANHSSFWDGFTAHALSGIGGWDGHCLMEERNLARYRFLARIGAFSIRRQEPRSALESLRYAARLLSAPRAVFVFPEGLLHGGTRLRPLERGVEVLARMARADCLPMAFRYAFFEHELPDVLVSVGEVHPPAPLEVFAERLDALHRALQAADGLDGFRPLIRGRRGIAELWGARP